MDRLRWWWVRRGDVADLAHLRANNLWALTGQRATRQEWRRLRREAKRDLTL